MPDPSRVSLNAVIEAIVLAFSRSDLRTVVPPDAFRMVLNSRYGGLVPGGRLSLQEVWSMLQGQPGVQPEVATPAFCLIKSWEQRFGMPVDLPAHLNGLSQSERAAEAAKIKVGVVDLDRALAAGTAAPASEPASRPRVSEPKKPVAPRMDARQRRLTIGLAVGIAAAAGLAGWRVVREVSGGGDWKPAKLEDLLEPLPVKTARKLGKQVTVTIGDPAWFEQSAEERRAQLTRAIERLSDRDFDSLAVLSPDGQLKATAQLAGEPPRPVVVLLP